MRGIVAAINDQRGMVAIETPQDFTIIELMGSGHIELGDTMSWSPDTAMGSQTYTNETRGTSFRVFVQNHMVPRHQVNQQIG